VTGPPYRSERLGASHEASGFGCGYQDLDDWLRQHAALAQAKRTSVTYVWTAADAIVVAYYSLAPHLIENSEIPRRLSRGDPRQIPAILLARLALSG
jgi:hypothetical protein